MLSNALVKLSKIYIKHVLYNLLIYMYNEYHYISVLVIPDMTCGDINKDLYVPFV